MSSKFYDVMIIGENSAGLIAAALLASRKYSVLLVPEITIRDKKLSLGKSYRADKAIYPGVFDCPIPTAVIRELNLGHKLRSVFKPAVPIFQAVDPEHRLTIFNDRLRLVTELQREYGKEINPDDVGNLMSWLEEINLVLDKLLVPGLSFFPGGMKEKWDLNNRIKHFNRLLSDRESMLSNLNTLWRESALGKLMQKLQLYAGNVREGFYDLFAFRRAYTLFNEVLYPITDNNLNDLFVDNLQKKNATIVEKFVLDEYLNDRNGHWLHGSKNSYGASSIICGLDYFNLKHIMTDKKTAKFISGQLDRICPTHCWIRNNLSIDRDVIPKVMHDNLFLLPENGNKNLRFLHRDPLLHDKADFETLEINTTIKVDDLFDEKIERCEKDMQGELEWLVPFVKDRIRKTYPEKALKAQGDKYLKISGRNLQYTNNKKSEIFSGVPYNLSGKNSYLAGPEVLPELGLEGDFITGWAIAQQICHKWPKKDELK